MSNYQHHTNNNSNNNSVHNNDNDNEVHMDIAAEVEISESEDHEAPSNNSAMAESDHSNSVDLLNDLLNKATNYMAKTSIGKEFGLAAGSRSSHSTSSKKRKTEKEEDEELLVDEEENDLSQIIHLTEQPANITGKMRSYQLEGLNWLIRLWHGGVSGILADEMGLGKTLQSISMLAYLRLFHNIKGPHLILTPLTTLGNWEREVRRWCPDINLFKFHGNKEQRAEWIREGKLHSSSWDVLLTSYEMAMAEKSALAKTKWHFIVIDEAHRLKNEKSKFAQIVRFFNSKYRLLITGTPVRQYSNK
jgi:SWI/SNF-related matrix-associated actin-dependent regulator of chromatin subfamily A member 5